MKKIIALLFIVYTAFTGSSLADDLSRLDIQNLFIDTPGNASRLPIWQHKYLNKRITWTGKIFSLSYQDEVKKTEILMKLLPYTKMYDTIVYIPANIKDKFNEGDEVTFTGKIIRGIDLFGVREVQVEITKNMQDSFGGYVFSNDSIINTNILKPSSGEDEPQ